jgi:hypothetical protein
MVCEKMKCYSLQLAHIFLCDLSCSLKLFYIFNAKMNSVDAKGGLAKRLFDIVYSRRLAGVNRSWLDVWGLEKLFVGYACLPILGGQILFILASGAPVSEETRRFINICLG